MGYEEEEVRRKKKKEKHYPCSACLHAVLIAFGGQGRAGLACAFACDVSTRAWCSSWSLSDETPHINQEQTDGQVSSTRERESCLRGGEGRTRAEMNAPPRSPSRIHPLHTATTPVEAAAKEGQSPRICARACACACAYAPAWCHYPSLTTERGYQRAHV